MKRIKIDFTKKHLYPVDTASLSCSSPDEVLSSGVKPISAAIPGNVEVDMQNAGILPDLFFGTNILKLEDYELYDYWYNSEFSATKM